MAIKRSSDFDELLLRIDREAKEEGPTGLADLRALQLKYSMINSLIQQRRRLHWTQEQLAERSGIGQAEISKIERGRKSPTLDTYARLAFALELGPIIQSAVGPTIRPSPAPM